MDKELFDFIEKLKNSVNDDDFISIAYEITDQLEEKENGFVAVEPILMIIETNPNIDFGSPGPLVHYVERFYEHGYEEKLIDSIKRRPTELTVWMLNRIVNGSEGDKKKYYIKLMEEVLIFPGLEQNIINEVENFLEFQRK